MNTKLRSRTRVGAGHQYGSFALFVLSLVLSCFCASVVSVNAQTPREAYVEPSSIDASTAQLVKEIKQAVEFAGGNITSEKIHLVLAFSTGHFSKDPLSSQAARQVATQLVRSLLVPGDQLSVFAWEMDVWQHKPVLQNPYTVPPDRNLDELFDLWPLTPQAESEGGHDTERAIVSITSNVARASNAVIVLLTNTAASISPRGQKVIGTDAAEYQGVIQSWRRMPQVNRSGASVILSYTVRMPTGESIGRTLDIVLLVPAQFHGGQLPNTRDALLSLAQAGNLAPRAESHPQAEARPDNLRGRRDASALIVLAILALLGLLAFAVYWFLSGRRFKWPLPNPVPTKPLLLVVGEQRFDISSLRVGEEVCHLVGQGFQEPTLKTVTISSAQQVPPIKIAKLIKEKDVVVRIKGDKLQVQSIDKRQVLQNSCVVQGEGLHDILLSGDVQLSEHLLPRAVTVRIEIGFVRSS